MFEKLKGFEQPLMLSASEDVEDESQSIRTGKRLLRSLALVFGCVAVSSLAYTGILNAIEFFNSYIPRVIIDGQELLVTLSSAIMLFFLGSYYRIDRHDFLLVGILALANLSQAYARGMGFDVRRGSRSLF